MILFEFLVWNGIPEIIRLLLLLDYSGILYLIIYYMYIFKAKYTYTIPIFHPIILERFWP